MKVWIRFITEELLERFESNIGLRALSDWKKVGPMELQGPVSALETTTAIDFLGLDMKSSSEHRWINNVICPVQDLSFVRFEQDDRWQQKYSRCRHRDCTEVEIDSRTLGHMSTRVLMER